MSSKRSFVLCISLTPCVQRTLEIPAFELNEVNRAHRVTVTPSGKGVNVALVLQALGVPARVFGFQGGPSGQWLAKELGLRRVQADWIELSQGATRTCTTILDADRGHVTELVEEAPMPAEEDWETLEEDYEINVEEAGDVCFSGALMPGAPPDLYKRLCKMASSFGVRAWIDSQKEPLLQALAAKPFFVKLNARELAATTGADTSTEAGCLAALRTLRKRGAQRVLMTHGPHPSLLIDDAGAAFRVTPPSIKPVNPIGSGDSVTAGILAGLRRDYALPDAVALGTACGAANALTLTPGFVNSYDVERLRKQVRVEPVA